MSLFKLSETELHEAPKHSPIIEPVALHFNTVMVDDLKRIYFHLGVLEEEGALYFMTDGAWSNIDLVEQILKITGPAEVDFCTWSIGSETLRKFAEWQGNGDIVNLNVILDQGIRNRKPEILQQASGVFRNLKLIKCHAKVCVISTPKLCFSIIGSANFTQNPRKEAGFIVRSYVVATVNKHWIRKEFENGNA